MSGSPSERDHLLAAVLRTAIEATAARMGAIYLLEPKANQLFVRTQEGFGPEDYVRFKLKLDEPMVKHVGSAGHPLPVGGQGDAPELADYLAEAAAETMLLAPVVARGMLVGLLDLRGSERGGFTDKDVAAAGAAAKHAGSAAMTFPSIEAILPPAAPGEAPPPPAPGDSGEEAGFSTAVMKTLKKTGAIAAKEVPGAAPAAPPAAVPAATGKDARAKEERRRRPLLLPADLLREAMPPFFQVLPVDLVTVGLVEEGIVALYHVASGPTPAEIEKNVVAAVRTALGKLSGPAKEAEILHEELIVLQEAAAPIQGPLSGTYPLAVSLPRHGSETQTTLVLVAVQIDRLGFGSDAQELLATLAGSLKNLFLQRLRTLDYRQGYLSLLNQILKPIEKTLPYMKSHSLAVANYAKQISLKLELDEMMVENVIVAAILHDVGLLDVDFDILKSKGKLSEKDQHEIRKHPVFSREWVEQVTFPYPVAPMVYAHHERWDGKGYPEGLRGEAIPLGARIIGVAEAFDAMTSRHSYKSAIAPAAALEEIQANAGTQFDPRVVEAFISVLRRPAKRP